MSYAPPPLQYFQGIIYNPDFFTSISSYITLSYANANYLTRIGTSLSASTLTQFAGNVSVLGLLTISGGISLSGGLSVDSLIVSGTSLFQGQSTFNLIPILPSGFQFITTGSQTIDGTKTFNLIPILPSGFQFITTGSQTIIGSKTFSNVLTTAGINDSLSITSPNITGSTVVNGAYFNATNPAGSSSFYTTTISGTLFSNLFSNSSSTVPYTLTSNSVAIPSGTNSSSGLQIGWNGTVGTGETNFINLGQAGAGGFQFGTISNSLSYRALCDINLYSNYGLWLFSNVGRLRIDDRNGGAFFWSQSQEGSQMQMSNNGISTSIILSCGNSLGISSTALSINSLAVSTNINFNPLSTSTFNFSHPTTTLGNNLSTNTTQYATVGYVNANSGASILSTNNTWTGTNGFTQRLIQVGNATQYINFGCGVGNIANIVIGDSSSLSTISATGANICISSPATSSMYNTTGSGNICLGGLSATLLTSGNGNTFLGGGCGQTITTGSNNTVIGSSAWSTGTANFSNCTVLGTNAPEPVANNSIVIGSSSETIYVAGASQLNNSLLYGTTVCSSSVLQINNQTKRFESVYTTGVANTLTNPLPFMILFTPIAGMSFTLPIPSSTNAGQTFIIRRAGTGGGQSIAFGVTGGGAVWVPVNSGTAVASFVVSVTWQFTFYSNGTNYICIA